MYLLQRGHWYHFRARIPSDLIDIYQRAEYHQSLKTSDGRTARAVASQIRNKLESDFQRIRLGRMSGLDDRELSEAFCSTVNSSSSKPVMRLSQLIESYLDDRSKHVQPRTLLIIRHAFSLLILIIGDVCLNQLDRPTCRRFRDTLLRLPPRCLQKHRGRSVEQIIAVGEKPMHPKTVNKNIQFVSAMLKWAEREELIDRNPASGLSVSINKKASSERKAYSQDELLSLFSDWPNELDNPEEIWIPIVSLYSGLRLEEICQLRCCDIAKIEKHHFIEVTSGAGLLKSPKAERIVPVHPALANLGFLNFCNDRNRVGEERLWPNLKTDRYGKFSSAFSKWFGRHKRSKGINDRLLTFHSLRHTFIDELKQNGVHEPVIAELAGHEIGSITLDRYGKDYRTTILIEAVGKLSFTALEKF